jgi:predicted DNA-binding transcriptional regulator AlpA
MNANSNLRSDRPRADQQSLAESRGAKSATSVPVVLTPKEAARSLKLSNSWLAKARMRGDGPPFIRIGRSIRYAEVALTKWMKSRQRSSTSEQ